MPRGRPKKLKNNRIENIQKNSLSQTDDAIYIPSNPFYEGASVVKIIDKNRSNGKYYLCEMSDRTTKDVPAELFITKESERE